MSVTARVRRRFALGGAVDPGPRWLREQSDRPPQRVDLAPLIAGPLKPVRQQVFNAWLDEQLRSEHRLQAVMVGFWSDHFHTSVGKAPRKMWPLKAVEQQILRANWRHFPSLLRAMTVSPSMLLYLDNLRNRKGRPNENQARELLELHTLGVEGGYAHVDIVETAKVLSGWTLVADLEMPGFGSVRFAEGPHEPGDKQVFGARIPEGEGGLAVLLEHLCRQPATLRRIARKLCLRFGSPTPSKDYVQSVAAALIAHNWDTVKALEAVVAHAEFESRLFVRPQELVIRTVRDVGATVAPDNAIPGWLERLGHGLWAWPTPDGAPVHKDAWDDDLRTRWAFATALVTGKIRGVRVGTLPDGPETLPPRLRPIIALAGPEAQWA